MATSGPVRHEKQQFGRELFLQRIARFRRHPVSIKEGINQAAALANILGKAGVSRQDLAEIRAKSTDYTRAVGESFIESLQRKELSGMSYFEKSAQFSAYPDYAGRGRVVPMRGVGFHTYQCADFPPPPPPPPQYLPPDMYYRDCVVSGAGTGDGIDWPWVSDDGTRGGSCDVEWQFSLTPAETNAYTFSALVVCGGIYYLVANDGPFDSKEARCELSCYLGVSQPLSKPVILPDGSTANTVQAITPAVDLFEEDGQNILDGGGTGGSTVLNLTVLLFADQPVDISVIVTVDAWARGDGSIAVMNFARPKGALACTGVTVTPF